MYKNSEVLSFQSFITKYMQAADNELIYKKNQIQIYPLAMANKYINPPTQLFRAEYSFLLFFTNGGGLQQIDSDIFEIKKNDILFIREGHINAIKEIKSNTEGYYIYIDYKLLKEIINPNLLKRITYNPKVSINESKIHWLDNCCKLMMDNQEIIADGSEIKKKLLQSFILMVAEDWNNESMKLNKSFKVLLDFKELVYANFQKEHHVDFYANALALSQNYLTRCVKEVSGKSPKQLLNEIIISQSKIYLLEDNLSISEIAYQLSFKDPAYFSRLFKKVTGLSPKQYKNK